MTSQDHRSPIYPHNSDQNSKDCVICFGEIVNKAFVDGCFHYFCYKCISMWIKHKATCPLCLREIDRLITDVISADVYKIVRLHEILQDQFKIGLQLPRTIMSRIIAAQQALIDDESETSSTDSGGHHGDNLDVINEENENPEETEHHDDSEAIHVLSEDDSDHSFLSDDIEWEVIDGYEESADSGGHQENNLDEMTNEENENSEESENYYYEQDEGTEEDEPYELEVAYSSGLEEDEYEEEFYNSYGPQYSSEEYEYVIDEPTVESDHSGQSEYSDDDEYDENGEGASQSESNDSSQYFDMEELGGYLSPSDDVSTDQLEEIMYGLDIQSSDGLSSDEQFEGDEQEQDSDSNYSFIYDEEIDEYDDDTQDTQPESEYDEYYESTDYSSD